MTTDRIVTLRELHAHKESDGSGGSEPYLWTCLVTIAQDLSVRGTPPAIGEARLVMAQGMRAGQTAPVPASVGVRRLRTEDGEEPRGLILVTALLENDETPLQAVEAGYLAFMSEVPSAIQDHLLLLNDPATRDEARSAIADQVAAAVDSAIRGALTTGQKIRVKLGLLNMDDAVDSAVQDLSGAGSTPISLHFAGDTGGRLLRYVDASQTGGGEVSSPQVVGQAGWYDFGRLFAGGPGVIYAVDTAGRLLRYVDASQTGGGEVSSPQVIGQGGWQQFRHLFAGSDPGVIYAVDTAGRLLRYVDASQTGGGEVSSPQVIGQGGWQQFRHLFAGSDPGVIYAVDTAGRLLRYVDASQTGGGEVSSPQVIGQGGWQQFRHLFAGSDPGVIYAVDTAGRLLRYVDASQTGGGEVSSPQVIGQGGWQQFVHLFASGDPGVIYAVDPLVGASEHYEITGDLLVVGVPVDAARAIATR